MVLESLIIKTDIHVLIVKRNKIEYFICLFKRIIGDNNI
jgi:hypothetical protein